MNKTLSADQLRYIDMAIQDSRAYLAGAKGEIKEATRIQDEEESRSADELVIRMKLLKDACMRAAGLNPLAWDSATVPTSSESSPSGG